MMMDPTLLELVGKERINDLLRAAANDRLVNAARAANPHRGQTKRSQITDLRLQTNLNGNYLGSEI